MSTLFRATPRPYSPVLCSDTHGPPVIRDFQVCVRLITTVAESLNQAPDRWKDLVDLTVSGDSDHGSWIHLLEPEVREKYG